LAVASEATTTLTGTQNDVNFSSVTTLRLNNASDLTITGFAAGVPGQRLILVSVGAGNVYLAHQNAGSTAINRLVNFVTSGNTPIAAGAGTATFVYDGTTSRWRLVNHSMGAWLTVPYTAGDYTGNGAMTVTVTAGQRSIYKYFLNGRTLSVSLGLNGFSVAGVVNNLVQVLIPNGYTVATQVEACCRIGNNAALGTTTGLIVTVPSSSTTKILIATTLLTTTNWAASVTNSAAFGSLSFDVD
jgi:hypothetical protein